MSVSLRSLSDNAILSRTRALTVQERRSTLLLLTHLNEIERRRLHLKQGYQSMFDYCAAGLGYSASAAMRRIRTARCIARFPEVYELLESNQVNLSTISQVSRVLTVDNRADILRRIRGKSQREVEAVVAEYEPRAALPPDRVRTVVMRVPVAPMPSPERVLENSHNRNGCGREDLSRVESADEHNRNGCDSESPKKPNFERRALIQFSASEVFMAKVERVRSLAWHRLPSPASFEQVFELALDHFIAHEDHGIRHERRKERERAAAQAAIQEKPRQATQSGRGIPAAVRDQVFARDKGQCAYTGSGGRRCASTRALQVDHINPVARGGGGTPDNLRLLCAYHNRLEAERVMGRRGVRDGPSPR